MALQLNDTGSLVKKWQQFLKDQGFFMMIPMEILVKRQWMLQKHFKNFTTYNKQALPVA